MDIVMDVFRAIFDNIISFPPFLMAILVFVGYLLADKTGWEAFGGAIKAAVGYMILQVGSGGMIRGFNPILEGLLTKYNLSAAVIDSNIGFSAANEAIIDIGESLASTMFVLLIGFVVNIILIIFNKITKIRTLYTTGHIMVKQAGFITWMIFFALPDYRNTTGIILIGILIGVFWSVFSNLTVEATQNLTDGERVFAVGHSQMLGIWVADKVSHLIGDPNDDVESIKLPGALDVLSDNIVGSSIIMLVMFGSILTILGPETMVQVDPEGIAGMSYFSYLVQVSLSFTVNFIILQTGVKMFVSEITESFQGISDKVLKGAVPAVDCAATFGFASNNTVLIGFIFGFLGQLIAIIGLIVFKSPILMLTGFVPVFFDNATLAVYANKRGGRRAAMFVPFVSGILQTLLGAMGVMLYGLATYGGWYGNLDISTVWLAIGGFIKSLGFVGAIIAILLMLVIPQLQYRRNQENYF